MSLTFLVAHPVRLAATGSLLDWQLAAARHRLMQPFKQLFREFYTAQGEEGTTCLRFADRRVDARRAYAVLRAAGFAPGTGTARREWPGVTAHLCWAQNMAGRDLFGTQRPNTVTTGAIWFTRAEEQLPISRSIRFSSASRCASPTS